MKGMPLCQSEDSNQVAMLLLHNCLRGHTSKTAKIGVRDCDIFETKLMQGQKEPRHLRRWADPVVLVCGEGGQTCSDVDGERLVRFGGAGVLCDVFSKSCRHSDLERVDLTAVRYRKKRGGP